MDWYVLYLKPRCEKKMAGFCQHQKHPFYLPLRQETKVYQRRRVIVEKPVFPGYFFVTIDGDGRVDLLKTNNVVRIIEPPSRRQFLHELAQIRKALEVDPTLGSCTAIKTGHYVRITGGPFMGVEGTVSSLRGRTKVCLNVEMVGQAVLVEVEREFIEVLS